MLTSLAFLIFLVIDSTYSSPLGRQIQSTDVNDQQITWISLLCLFVGPCIIYSIIGTLRGKNCCYIRTGCDRKCNSCLLGYINWCDDICEDDCSTQYYTDSWIEMCCTCGCKCICGICEICRCPYDENDKPIYYNHHSAQSHPTQSHHSYYKSTEQVELEKMSKTIDEYSNKNKIQSVQPKIEETVIDSVTNIIIDDEPLNGITSEV